MEKIFLRCTRKVVFCFSLKTLITAFTQRSLQGWILFSAQRCYMLSFIQEPRPLVSEPDVLMSHSVHVLFFPSHTQILPCNRTMYGVKQSEYHYRPAGMFTLLLRASFITHSLTRIILLHHSGTSSYLHRHPVEKSTRTCDLWRVWRGRRCEISKSCLQVEKRQRGTAITHNHVNTYSPVLEVYHDVAPVFIKH